MHARRLGRSGIEISAMGMGCWAIGGPFWKNGPPVGWGQVNDGESMRAIQQQLNVFEGNPKTLEVCEQFDLASINRGPLNMGLLTGKFTLETGIPKDDLRSRRPAFQEDRGRRLDILDRIRGVLVQDGRTLAQGALGWLWARSQRTIPIPGFKTIAQVEENSAAMNFGPLSEKQMEQIAELLVETHPDSPLQCPQAPLEPYPTGCRS